MTQNVQKSKYDISKSTAPATLRLGKGTECVQLLLSQVSKDMHEPMVPMLFPILGAQISEAKFRYPDLIWKELFGMMKNLVADSGCKKRTVYEYLIMIQKDIFNHFPNWRKKIPQLEK